jgi:ferrous iron transport protein A
MSLKNGVSNKSYIITKIQSKQNDMKEFLFSLGCYPGEKITIISKLASNYIVNIKDSRYSIDENLANAIIIKI